MKNESPDPPDDLIRRVELAMPLTQDPTILILKGHLIVEEQLERLLRSLAENSSRLDDARLTFHQKLALSQALVGEFEEDENIWSQLRMLNGIRNHLAHNLDASKVDDRVRELTGKSVNDWQKLDQNGRAVELRDVLMDLSIGLIWFIDELFQGPRLRELFRMIENKIAHAEAAAGLASQAEQ